jgi:hypothetical protein
VQEVKLESRIRVHVRSPHPEVLIVPVTVDNELP